MVAAVSSMKDSGFVPVSEYRTFGTMPFEFGSYISFSVALSWGGHKRQLLHYRLRGIMVRVLPARRLKRMRETRLRTKGRHGHNTRNRTALREADEAL